MLVESEKKSTYTTSIEQILHPPKVYRHYGHSVIVPEWFDTIKNDGWIKPTGGLWASPVREDAYTWKEFLDCEWKRDGGDIGTDYFDFSLKEGARVLYINSAQDLENLPKIQPRFSFMHWVCLDFEELAKTYDAIEVNISREGALRHDLDGWDVDSLLVFNKDVMSLENSYIIFPQTMNALSNEYKVPQKYICLQDGRVYFYDGTTQFVLAKVNREGEIIEKLSRKDFEEEMAGLGDYKRTVRNSNQEFSKKTLSIMFNLPPDGWMMQLRTHTHLDGTAEIFVEHGTCPQIAALKSDGRLETMAHKEDVVKGILHAELAMLEQMEKGLKNPSELREFSIDQIRKMAESFKYQGENDYVNTDLMVGLILQESLRPKFPSPEERIGDIDLESIYLRGSKAVAQEIRLKRQQTMEHKEEIDRDRA